MQRETLFGVSKQSFFIFATIVMLGIETSLFVAFIMLLLVNLVKESKETIIFFRTYPKD